MLQKTISLIEQSHHIAILLPKNPTLDCLIAAEVLVKALVEQSKNVGFLARVPLPQNHETLKSLPPSLSKREEYFPVLSTPSPLPRDFIISIDTTQSPVAQLKYEKNNETLDIILSPKESRIKKEHITYKTGGILCDCAILFGGENIDSMEQGEEIPPDFFTKTSLARIYNGKIGKDENEADYVYTEKTSLCEMVYSLLSSLIPSALTQETASLLLTGIIHETNNFTAANTNADTLLAASELMRLGAAKKSDLLEHISEKKETPSLNFLHLCGRAIVRSKYRENASVFVSYLTPDDFEKTHTEKGDAPLALAAMARMLPYAPSHILFWRVAENEDIHVIASGLNAVFERPPFMREENHPLFILDQSFPSFEEAEEQVMRLIASIL